MMFKLCPLCSIRNTNTYTHIHARTHTLTYTHTHTYFINYASSALYNIIGVRMR